MKQVILALSNRLTAIIVLIKNYLIADSIIDCIYWLNINLNKHMQEKIYTVNIIKHLSSNACMALK